MPSLVHDVPRDADDLRTLDTEGGDPRRAVAYLRLYVSGSAALSPNAFERVERVFGERSLERYGMTETGMNLTNP
jgi:malonyl-CoA/methylmalonyl-CoA synthetase